MRDYKLRKKVFNEYPTTAEVQKMIAQGGGGSGETREPTFSVDAVAETPHQLNNNEMAYVMAYSINMEVYVNNIRFYFDSAEEDGDISTLYYYPNDEDYELVFNIDASNRSATVTSSINGTIKVYINTYAPIIVYAGYNDDTITSYVPAYVLLSNILGGDNGGAILDVQANDVRARGALTVSQYLNGSTRVYAISCDIDISGKFTYSIDDGYIKGVHGSA